MTRKTKTPQQRIAHSVLADLLHQAEQVPDGIAEELARYLMERATAVQLTGRSVRHQQVVVTWSLPDGDETPEQASGVSLPEDRHDDDFATAPSDD